MKRKNIDSINKNFEALIDWEMGVYRKYQNVIKKNSLIQELDWVFDLQRGRQRMLSVLFDELGVYGIKGKDLSGEAPLVNGSWRAATKYLLEAERQHIAILEKHINAYSCSMDKKKVITERLLPLANANVAELSKGL